MTESVNEKKVQLAVQSGFRRMKRFQRARAMFLKQYVGHYYREQFGMEGDEPINMIFHVIRSLVPNLVMRSPVNLVTTEIAEYKTYAWMLGLALDNLGKQLRLKDTVRRAIVDSFFAMGIVKTGLSATDQLIDFGDIRVDPGQVYADTVDFDDFVFDPSCRMLEEAAFTGHRERIPRQLLLDDDQCDHDLVMRLPRSGHPDAKKRASALSQGGMSDQEMIELQDFVDIVSLYVPGANSSILVPDPDQLISDGYIKLQDFYGPKTGPYHFLSLTQPVPGNPFPIAPVGIWYDLHIMCNKLMRKQMIRAENQKTVYVVDPSSVDQAEDMREAEDSEVILGHPDTVGVFSSNGAEKGTEATLSNLQVWFNYMSGNPDQMAGLASNADTATQATILEGNANVTVEDSRGIIYDFVAGIGADLAWYLHYDPLIDVPMTVRKKEVAEVTGAWVSPEEYQFPVQIRLTPEQRRGEHFQFTFKIKSRSMSALDPVVTSKRLVEFATNVVPAVIAAASTAMQMGVPFNVQRAITTLAEQLELSDQVQDWFNDPEFMNRLQLRISMGPQPEGKGGLNIQGVRQNGGFPGQTSFGANPMNQNAQDIAGMAQAAMKGGMRGTPGSRGPGGMGGT
jgi:hypothetical protein